jgi:hypothetical protein
MQPTLYSLNIYLNISFYLHLGLPSGLSSLGLPTKTSCAFLKYHACYMHRQTHITPWSRVLSEKLIIPQLVNKFSDFYGIWKFITVFTRARRYFLYWARCIDSILYHPISLRSILILSSHLHLGLPSSLFPFLSEKLIIPLLVKKCPAIYGTRYFIIMFTRAHQ